MKFYMVVNIYLVSLCIKFYEDPCINVRSRVVKGPRTNSSLQTGLESAGCSVVEKKRFSDGGG